MKNKQFSKDINISGFKVFETKELRDRAFNFYKKQINLQNKINRIKGKKLLKPNPDNFVFRVKFIDKSFGDNFAPAITYSNVTNKQYFNMFNKPNILKELKKSFNEKPLSIIDFFDNLELPISLNMKLNIKEILLKIM